MNNELLILEKLGSIEVVLVGMRSDIDGMKVEMGSMNGEMGGMKGEISELKEDVRELKDRVGGVESRLGGVENRIGGVETRLGGVETRLGGVETRLGGVESREDLIVVTLLNIQSSLEKFATKDDVQKLRNEMHGLFDTQGKLITGISLEMAAFNSYRGRTDKRVDAVEELTGNLNERVNILEHQR